MPGRRRHDRCGCSIRASSFHTLKARPRSRVPRLARRKAEDGDASRLVNSPATYPGETTVAWATCVHEQCGSSHGDDMEHNQVIAPKLC